MKAFTFHNVFKTALFNDASCIIQKKHFIIYCTVFFILFLRYVTYGKCIRSNDRDTWVLISTRSYWGATAWISRTFLVLYNYVPIRRTVCECCNRTAVFKQLSGVARTRVRIFNFPICWRSTLTKLSNLIELESIRAGIEGEAAIWKPYVIFLAVEWVRVSLLGCQIPM
jgi:hypothetical protein